MMMLFRVLSETNRAQCSMTYVFRYSFVHLHALGEVGFFKAKCHMIEELGEWVVGHLEGRGKAGGRVAGRLEGWQLAYGPVGEGE